MYIDCYFSRRFSHEVNEIKAIDTFRSIRVKAEEEKKPRCSSSPTKRMAVMGCVCIVYIFLLIVI